MRVILKQDIAKLGRKNEVKEVNDGFARNFLLSKGKAVLATPANLAKLGEVNKLTGEQENRNLVATQQLLEQAKDKTLKIKAKANSETGHLFASIHKQDLSLAIKEQFSLELDPNLLIIPQPIKQLGQHEIKLVLGKGQTSSLMISVEAVI